ncbi:MAG: TerD family protein [Alphaproteobacteria bacterium]|nr:TerD family protein [Alphaproteobacteria bacterium]
MSRRDILDTEFENAEIKISDNLVKPGDDINITEKDPALKKIMIGCGWDLNTFQGEDMDVDVSIFLLDKNEQTREDEDFIFYNSPEGCNGAVKHTGDNRTGAGDGDDETIMIDLLGLPFDVVRIAIVVSIYQGYEKDQSLSRVKNCFVRLVNADNEFEILRYELKEELRDQEHDFAMVAALIDREGPKWHFRPLLEFYKGGLAEIATKYGIVIMRQ